MVGGHRGETLHRPLAAITARSRRERAETLR